MRDTALQILTISALVGCTDSGVKVETQPKSPADEVKEPQSTNGGSLAIPVGSLNDPSLVTVSDGQEIGNDETGKMLNLPSGLKPASSSVEIDLGQPYTTAQAGTLEIGLPIEGETGLALGSFESKSRLIILYRVRNRKKIIIYGMIPRSKIRRDRGKFSGPFKGNGSYQAVLLPKGTPPSVAEEEKTAELDDQTEPPTFSNSTPVAVASGDTVILKGENFSKGMKIRIGGTFYEPEILGYNEIQFHIPSGIGNGLIAMTASNGIYSAQIEGFYSLVDTTYPIFSGDSGWICNDQKFYNASGALTNGTKNCTSAGVDLSNLSAGNILSGVTIGGVTGSVTAAASNCSSDGETGCKTTSSYPAVDTSGLAAKLANGLVAGGVTGTNAASESHSDCASDGDTFCVATATYTAALTTGAASKIPLRPNPSRHRRLLLPRLPSRIKRPQRRYRQ